MENNWLHHLLIEHGGILHTANGVELSTMPAGSYYLYCDHPASSENRWAVELGICREFQTVHDFEATTNCRSRQELEQLTAGLLLEKYLKGGVSISAYLPLEDGPCHLRFSNEEAGTSITDFEKETCFCMQGRLDNAVEFVSFTWRYAHGLIRDTNGHCTV